MNKLVDIPELKCLYCDKILTCKKKDGHFLCRNHEVSVSYMFFSPEESMAYQYFTGTVGKQQYSLLFNLQDNICQLIKTLPVTNQLVYMTRLDHLPDIGPSQFEGFVQKLLDLMAFT
jgi:hypothetical protein